ncbi:hypothetical protein BJ322DRAFT_1023608 [Thelephora terrestris]|uniref:peptidylprolyl isomerase n=1 Tax=Thelephora terrestris TaxID=56493 RepID=A0A9P6H7R6_9AGAM|nr:hypothetical protein BJ322DRAFT_1023608 [Thelephora terrestris]
MALVPPKDCAGYGADRAMGPGRPPTSKTQSATGGSIGTQPNVFGATDRNTWSHPVTSRDHNSRFFLRFLQVLRAAVRLAQVTDGRLQLPSLLHRFEQRCSMRNRSSRYVPLYLGLLVSDETAQSVFDTSNSLLHGCMGESVRFEQQGGQDFSGAAQISRSLFLSPKRPTTYAPPRQLKLTNIALAHHLLDESTNRRTSVTLKAPFTEPTVICSLVPTKVEQAVIDIVLAREQEVVFELAGNNPVYLTGYFVGPEISGKVECFEREVGTGPLVSAGCRVSVHLLMRVMDGVVIENTLSNGKPLDIDLSTPPITGILQVLRDGLLGMKQGGSRKIVVPPSLARFELDGNLLPVEGLSPGDTVVLGISIHILHFCFLTPERGPGRCGRRVTVLLFAG